MAFRWYTSSGDDGYTSVLGRDRVPKYSLRPNAYGTVDEASAALGLARVQSKDERVAPVVLTAQRDLYHLMADLATLPEATTRPPWLSDDRLHWLEETTDKLGAEIDMPRAFIVPGDSVAGAALDLARAVTRRAERLVARLAHDGELRNDVPLRYLNRLSSLLFVLARIEDKAAGIDAFTLADAGH
jgi:cob(I)alamin adenosyltransferase